ncbi:hypothetical protein MK489_13685 [Myxococcota bacterium]|nr:hypothetical protein [Myxococcota bacterium]
MIEEQGLWPSIEARAEETSDLIFLTDERKHVVRFGEFRERAAIAEASVIGLRDPERGERCCLQPGRPG